MLLCRACGRELPLDQILYEDFQDHVGAYCELTSLQLHDLEEPGPFKICQRCVEKLYDFHTFRENCLHVHWGVFRVKVELQNDFPEEEVSAQNDPNDITDDEMEGDKVSSNVLSLSSNTLMDYIITDVKAEPQDDWQARNDQDDFDDGDRSNPEVPFSAILCIPHDAAVKYEILSDDGSESVQPKRIKRRIRNPFDDEYSDDEALANTVPNNSENVTPTKPSHKKRKRNARKRYALKRDSWVRKKKKYIRKNKTKTFQEQFDCGCPRKCPTKFDSESVLETFFNSFWNLEDWNQRKGLVSDQVKGVEVKNRKKKKRKSLRPHRTLAFQYFIPTEQENVRVCQKYFLGVLQTNTGRIYQCLERKAQLHSSDNGSLK